jgi:hypothetical protein
MGGNQMTNQTADRRSGSLLRSIGAVLLGLVVIVVLSLGTDQILHELGVYPPWGQPMNEPGDNFLAFAYRCVYGVIGGYVTARFSHSAPMRDALILGAVGLVLSMAGAIAAIPMNLGPVWYPIALVVIALPCAWLGARLYLWARR